MIILAKPYVSDFLIETIKKNNFAVLDNEIARQYFDEKYLTDTKDAIKKYQQGELFYTNSENSIDWISDNLKNSPLDKYIKICKDKALFRKTISKLYPDYKFSEVKLNEIISINPDKLTYPCILKPSVGFLSFGVYPINNKTDWQNVVSKIYSDVENLKNIFPDSVVDMTNFLIEEMIEGEEYAIDGYYDKNGTAVILNIFKHPFFDDKDVSDRAYYTGKDIFEKYYDKFLDILNKIGTVAGFKSFPFHIELRMTKNSIIPIEINPMRFAGWCITDMAKSAWKINTYEYYLKQLKPDWNNIIKNSDNDYYYFTIGSVEQGIEVKNINYDKYLKNMSNPLVVRKIDYKNNPLFAIVFAKAKNLDEIKNILKLDMKEFIS